MKWRRAHTLLPLLLRAINPGGRFLSTALLPRELALAEQVLAILHTPSSSSSSSSSIEAPLEIIAPRLSPHVVSTVLQDPSLLLPSAFRFFAWASGTKRLRSWLSHNLIISKLQAHLLKDHDLPWRLLTDLSDLGLSIVPPTFVVLISAYASVGMPERAVDTFARMPAFGCRPNTFAYNTMLRILLESGVGLLAMSLYTRMLKSDCRPNRATYTILIDALCKSGNNSDALRLFDEMLQRNISPNTTVYTVFLSSHCRAGRMEDADKLLNSMKRNSCKPDLVTYNSLLNGFCKSGRVDEGLECLKSFEQDGFVLGLDGYSCLIEGLFHAGRFEEACEYYNKMLAENVTPDCVLYTIMIKGYCEVGMVDEAFVFLRDMTARGLIPDTVCYNTLIKGLCDAGLLDRARSLWLEISENDQFPDSVTYTIMICGLCKEGLVHEAQQIFEEMGKLGCVPTVMTFNALIDGLCKARRLEQARILFHRMEMGRNPSLFLRLSQGADPVRDSNSLRKLVDELCQKGLVLKAYKLLRGIIDSGVVPDVVTYNILINGLCKAGNPDGALKLFKELQLKGHSPNEVTYGTLMDGLLKIHREEESLMVFQHMLRGGFTPSLSICNTLMRTLCRKRKVAQAVILWMSHILQESSLPEDTAIIKALLTNFQEGDLEAAVIGLIEMDCKRGSLVPFPYTTWLIGYCQARKVDEALKIFSILKDFDIDATPPSCVLLINCLCREGKLGPALDVMLYALRKGFLLMQPVGNRLLKKLCIHDRKKDACELAQRMHLSGYDMDAYLRAKTKALLYGPQINNNCAAPLTVNGQVTGEATRYHVEILVKCKITHSASEL